MSPKIDLVRGETIAYDVMVFTESWLNTNISNDSISIEQFHEPLRCHRTTRTGGGVVMYIPDNVSFKQRHDLEVTNLEAVWIDISLRGKTVLIGGFYRPPNSSAGYFDLIDESFDRAINAGIADTVILGDIIFNMFNASNNKMLDLIQQYDLKQLIEEPTHFTENSASLLDLILVRNQKNIITSCVCDTFTDSQVRFHCPV